MSSQKSSEFSLIELAIAGLAALALVLAGAAWVATGVWKGHAIFDPTAALSAATFHLAHPAAAFPPADRRFVPGPAAYWSTTFGLVVLAACIVLWPIAILTRDGRGRRSDQPRPDPSANRQVLAARGAAATRERGRRLRGQ